ncbi:hypothetical protein [Nostoc sp.]|uniref:hypothetical protein n=1 Tax=Nostoc sp. TaxID=1180 RepID=UPI002FF80834
MLRHCFIVQAIEPFEDKLPRSCLLTFVYHTFTNLRRSLLIGDRNYHEIYSKD